MPERIGHFREDDAKRIGAFFRRRGDRKQDRPRRPRRRVYSNGAAQNQNPTDPEDPANNNDCCEFGQLFICPLRRGIRHEILCSALDPPIDGEKIWKVRFFAVDDDGNEIAPTPPEEGSEEEGSENSEPEILEHTELLTLPCTEEVCKAVDLSGVTLGGVDIGMVNYGNQQECCAGRSLFSIWRAGQINFTDDQINNDIIQQGPLTTLNFTYTRVKDGAEVEFTIDAELIGIEEFIRDEFSENTTFTLRSTMVSSPPFTSQAIFGDVDIEGQSGGETLEVSVTASPLNDYRGIAHIAILHPDFNPPTEIFSVEWFYVMTN